MSRAELAALVSEIAQDSKNVFVTDHCNIRMEERGVTWIETIRCLRRGSIDDEPEYDHEHGNWKFKMRELPPRDIVCVVAAIRLDPESREVVAITVYEV